MVNILTQCSRFIIIILAAVYTIKCFTVFRPKHAWDRGSVYMTQNVLMFLIHFVCYMLIFINEKDFKFLVFYGMQVCIFYNNAGFKYNDLQACIQAISE